VPQKLLGPAERPADEYVCVRKRHTYSGEPFYYAEIYVPAPVFETLPKDTARNRKMLAAVLEE
jgi:GntR family transcriptional regulator